MSREFGESIGGYFHHKIDHATDDLRYANIELHKKLIPFFESLYKVAYQISNVEAGDSGEYASIDALKEQIPVMINELEKIQKELSNE
jgi:hypothetical protein